MFFFFNDTATTEIYTLSLHDALPISDLLATVGRMALTPDLINVIPEAATMTVDLRHPDAETLNAADDALDAAISAAAEATGCTATSQRLARFDPVVFDQNLVARIETGAAARGLTHRRLISGAGHDAQMLACICPAAMIFAPSISGISHNPAEDTAPEHIAAAVTVLADTLNALCHEVT